MSDLTFLSHKRSLAVYLCVLSAGGLYLVGEPWLPFRLHCVFKSLTGVPCPGCGTIRSLQLLLKGDVVQSVMVNPLGVILSCVALLSFVWLICDAVRNTDSLYRFFHKPWPAATIVVAALFTVANWVWNILKGL